MTGRNREPSGFTHWFRSHERSLAAAWIVGSALLVAALLVPPARAFLLGTVQSAISYWDDRWPRRLVEAQRLQASGHLVEAERLLEQLDRTFPARNVRHGRDKERERLLIHLGQVEEALGKKGKAVAAYQRLVAFDNLNYLNHYELGKAAERMLSGWAVAPEARDAFANALKLMPAHLGSLRGYLEYYLDRGEFIPAVDAYEKYLNSFLINRVEVDFADTTRVALFEVDGLTKSAALTLNCPPGCQGPITIKTGGFSASLDSVIVISGRKVGRSGGEERLVLPLDRIRAEEFDSIGPRTYRARSEKSALIVDLPNRPNGAIQLRISLRLYKPIDGQLWGRLAKGYQNLLRFADLGRAQVRTLPLVSEEEADLVLARLDWVKEGRQIGPNESTE